MRPFTAAVLTLSWPSGRLAPVARPYTPVTHSSTSGHLDLLVKRYPNGKQSTHLHSLRPGDSLAFVTALPGFKWTPNAFPAITCVAGGAGITPVFQLVQGILANPEDKTRITLVYGANSDGDVLLKDEFDEMEERFPGRLRVVYTVSKGGEGSPFQKGYVTKELLEGVVERRSGEDTKVFVCGPPAMEQALVGKGRGGGGILAELGFRRDQVYRF